MDCVGTTTEILITREVKSGTLVSRISFYRCIDYCIFYHILLKEIPLLFRKTSCLKIMDYGVLCLINGSRRKM